MKQVIVIRNDLNMRKGKMVAQGAHASLAFALDILRSGGTLTADQLEWVEEGQKKICVRAETLEELESVYRAACDAGMNACIITDAGHTEFGGVPTRTAVAIGPDDDERIDVITSHLKLL